MILIPSISIPPWIKRVVSWVFSPKGGLIILLGIVFITFGAVVANKSAEGNIGQSLGLSEKNEILTFLGLSMGGILLALQALISNTRARAMEDAAREQAKANENTERGQRQERLKNAIEHLGHDSISIRMGGAYELFHLAQDTKELRQTVLDILCAHIRQTTGHENYQDEHESKPSEEIQSLMNLLFVQEHNVFEGLHINLQGSWLNGAALHDARLVNAVLDKAYLRGASFGDAWLQGARFFKAQLQGASLFDAKLQGAKIIFALLQESNLMRAQLQGAWLDNVQLQGARLERVEMQGAVLNNVSLQGAVFVGAKFHGVTNDSFSLFSFETLIRDRIDKNSELMGVTFKGGIKQEDLGSLIEGLSEEAAERLCAKLNRGHVGVDALYVLPENSGAITGSYTKEEAEQWIAEYKKAVSEDSGKDKS